MRLHLAIGYVTAADKLAGRETAIFDEPDWNFAAARRAAALPAASKTGTQKKASGV